MKACFQWLKADYGLGENSTMAEINSAFRDWNMGSLILICVLLIPGIVGNSLVLAIFGTFRESTYRTFVLWLAALDLAGCLVVMPYLLANIVTPASMQLDSVCKIGRFVSYSISITSHFILIVIAVDRYKKICKPHSRQILHTDTSKYCVAMAILSVLLSIPAPILYGNSTIDLGIPGHNGTRCFTADEFMDTNYHLIYYIVINVVGAVVTMVISVLYFQVIKQIRQKYKAKTKDIKEFIRKSGENFQNGSDYEEKINKKLMRTTLTLMMVTIVFVLTVFPHTILALVDYAVKDFYCKLSFSSGFAFNTVMYIFLFNNVLNCWIYGFTDKRFKKTFLLLFRRQTFNLNEESTVESATDVKVKNSQSMGFR